MNVCVCVDVDVGLTGMGLHLPPNGLCLRRVMVTFCDANAQVTLFACLLEWLASPALLYEEREAGTPGCSVFPMWWGVVRRFASSRVVKVVGCSLVTLAGWSVT